MLKNNRVVKKLMETGEERLGKLSQQLFSNEKFMATLTGLVSRTLAAKGTVDKSLKVALSAMNLPSTQDVEQLRGRIDDLERLLSQVEGKLEQLTRKNT